MKCRLKLSALGTLARFTFNFVVAILVLIVIIFAFLTLSYGSGYITVHWFNVGFAVQALSDSNYYIAVGSMELLSIIGIIFVFIVIVTEVRYKKYYGFGWLIDCEGE